MELAGNTEPLRKLNTKGCCFLCLQTENINQTEELDCSQVTKSISIQYLLRHLKIQTAQTLDKKSIFGHGFKQDIQVDLCKNCEKMISKFSVLFQKLETIQLEMNYFLERIHKCISQSAKDTELVQNYSKRMTSDLEALSQLAFVDNLRKQLAKESLKKSNVPRLQLILTRVKIKLVKTENFDTTCEYNERDFSEDSPDETAPSSPNATADNNEDVKISISSASTSQKNEKLSPSLKPPMKHNTSKGKYYTKDFSTGMYKCNKCDKKSKRADTIADHFKNIHLKIRYKCDICTICVFNDLSNFKRHKKTCRERLEKAAAIKTEKQKFQFICNECGKRFKTQTNLRVHRLYVHKNVDRYSCDLCDKRFKRSYQLKNHRDAIHFGKRFYCRCCSKKFAYKGDMIKHERKFARKLALKEEPLEKP